MSRFTTDLVMICVELLNIFFLVLLVLALVYLVRQLAYNVFNRILGASSRKKSFYDLRDQ